jgi:iron(III) transport system ATP-binding protein
VRFELKRLQRDLNITAVYVTHDQTEALTMSTTIAVMNKGVVEQLGTPREIYNQPRSRFVADFIGTSNFLPGVVRDLIGDHVVVDTPVGAIRVKTGHTFAVKSPVTVCIRPEHVDLEEVADGENPQDSPGPWVGRVEVRSFLGDAVEHVVVHGEHTIKARTNPSKSIHPGSSVTVRVDGDWCSLIPA